MVTESLFSCFGSHMAYFFHKTFGFPTRYFQWAFITSFSEIKNLAISTGPLIRLYLGYTKNVFNSVGQYNVESENWLSDIIQTLFTWLHTGGGGGGGTLILLYSYIYLFNNFIVHEHNNFYLISACRLTNSTLGYYLQGTFHPFTVSIC